MVFLKFTVLNDFVFLVCLFAIHCYNSSLKIRQA